MMMRNNGTTSSALGQTMVFTSNFELFGVKSVRNFKLPVCVGEILFS